MSDNFARTDTDISQLLLGNNFKKPNVTIVSGQTITTGMLLGIITASGKLAQTKSGSVDGSEIPKYIAIADDDASAGDVVTEVLAFGEVNSEKLVFDGSDTLETVVSGDTFYNHLRRYGMLALTSEIVNSFDNA